MQTEIEMGVEYTQYLISRKSLSKRVRNLLLKKNYKTMHQQPQLQPIARLVVHKPYQSHNTIPNSELIFFLFLCMCLWVHTAGSYKVHIFMRVKIILAVIQIYKFYRLCVKWLLQKGGG